MKVVLELEFEKTPLHDISESLDTNPVYLKFLENTGLENTLETKMEYGLFVQYWGYNIPFKIIEVEV